MHDGGGFYAHFLEQLPLGRLQNTFAWINAALGHLPSPLPRIQTTPHKNTMLIVQQNNPYTGPVSFCHE
jgi:hypothetical protein